MEHEVKRNEEKKLPVFKKIYPIFEPYVYAAIVKESKTQRIRYEIIEPTLLKEEENLVGEIKDLLIEEVDVNRKDLKTHENAKKYLKNKIREIIKRHKIGIDEEAIDKVIYYIKRDSIGYGRIDALMKDQLIEDISADGVNVPIYIWHREYESLPTNIIYENNEELNSFITRLAYLSGKHISIAAPMLDATLPDGSRIQLTYGSEVTRRGSTFTIRRFRTDPLTISDLILFKTLSADVAAYLWYVIENRASVLVTGGAASGKTTMLNCLSMFIKPELKVISVEDTAELNLPHENWIPAVVRSGSGSKQQGYGGAITLFDLLKTAVRQRPDYIILGEVRGEEAYTLFQAMSTGHLGMSTVHAESVADVLRRLEAEPMNIPKFLLSMIDVVAVQLRTEVYGKPARRTVMVTEVIDLDSKTNELLTNDLYWWDAKNDVFTYSGDSHVLDRNMKKMGLEEKEVTEDLLRKKIILEWMVRNKIRKYSDVSAIIRKYYATPEKVYRTARMGAT